MGRFLIHVDSGGEDIVSADLLGKEVNSGNEERLNLRVLLALEELRVGGDERIYEADAIFSGRTSRRLDSGYPPPASKCALVG